MEDQDEVFVPEIEEDELGEEEEDDLMEGEDLDVEVQDE